jgi:hypothetical protein
VFVEQAAARPNADFVVIYIEEAHPTDGWHFASVPYHIASHRSIADRAAAANELETRMTKLTDDTTGGPPPLYVDPMDDSVSVAFGAVPERLAIVRDGRVEYLGGAGPMEYVLPPSPPSRPSPPSPASFCCAGGSVPARGTHTTVLTQTLAPHFSGAAVQYAVTIWTRPLRLLTSSSPSEDRINRLESAVRGTARSE